MYGHIKNSARLISLSNVSLPHQNLGSSRNCTWELPLRSDCSDLSILSTYGTKQNKNSMTTHGVREKLRWSYWSPSEFATLFLKAGNSPHRISLSLFSLQHLQKLQLWLLKWEWNWNRPHLVISVQYNFIFIKFFPGITITVRCKD